MKLAQFILVVLISIAASAGTFVLLRGGPAEHGSVAQETAYERVMRTNTIRCGYLVFPPYFTRDPQTGKLGGIWYQWTEALGEHLGLKIDWAEDVPYGDIAAALQAKRFDMYCGGLWTAGRREREINFLWAAAYEPMYVFARYDDHRFDNRLAAINDPGVRISAIDGEGGGLIAAEMFPKATMVSLPQTSSFADLYNQVVTGKADVVISAPSGVDGFLANNPDKLRMVTSPPLKIFPVALAVAYGEGDLRDLVNQAQEDLLYTGDLDRVIDQGQLKPGEFLHPSKGFAGPVMPAEEGIKR